MIGNRMRAFAFSAAFATFCFAAPALASPFDGSWKMQLVTTNGHCGVINIGVAITDGHITATSRTLRDAQDLPDRAHLERRRDQDQRRGRPAPGRRHRTLHARQGQRQVERHRALRRLLRLLGRRPRLASRPITILARKVPRASPPARAPAPGMPASSISPATGRSRSGR